MTIEIDLNLDPLVKALNKLVKASSDLNKSNKVADDNLKKYNKTLTEGTADLLKFTKTLGLTKTQVNQLLSTVNNLDKSNKKINEGYDKLREKLAAANKQLKEHNKEQKESAKNSVANGLAANQWVKHLIRLARYYVILKGAQLAYQQVLSTVTLGADFQQSIITLSGILRKSVDEISSVTEEITTLGASTEWTASQIADAARLLAMAGLDMNQVKEALSGVLELATAGNIDLARAADISTNILSAFGLEVSELGRVNDVLIATITRSNSTIEELSESMKYAAPVAKALGYEIEEVAAYLGVLHNAGIKGSQAGTNLARAMFMVGKVFRTLNLDSVTLSDRLGIGKGGLQRALQGVKEEAWGAEKVMKVFGDRGAKAALIFLDLGEQITILEEKIKASKGESAKLAETMRSSLNNQFKVLQSIIEDIKLSIFNDNIKLLESILNDLKTELKENAEGIKVIGKALYYLARAIIFVVFNLDKLLGLMTSMVLRITTGSPVLSGLITAFRMLSKESDKARDSIGKTMEKFDNEGLDLGVPKGYQDNWMKGGTGMEVNVTQADQTRLSMLKFQKKAQDELTASIIKTVEAMGLDKIDEEELALTRIAKAGISLNEAQRERLKELVAARAEAYSKMDILSSEYHQAQINKINAEYNEKDKNNLNELTASKIKNKKLLEEEIRFYEAKYKLYNDYYTKTGKGKGQALSAGTTVNTLQSQYRVSQQGMSVADSKELLDISQKTLQLENDRFGIAEKISRLKIDGFERETELAKINMDSFSGQLKYHDEIVKDVKKRHKLELDNIDTYEDYHSTRLTHEEELAELAEKRKQIEIEAAKAMSLNLQQALATMIQMSSEGASLKSTLGAVGSGIGSAWGPVGSAVGGIFGQALGELLGPKEKQGPTEYELTIMALIESIDKLDQSLNDLRVSLAVNEMSGTEKLNYYNDLEQQKVDAYNKALQYEADELAFRYNSFKDNDLEVKRLRDLRIEASWGAYYTELLRLTGLTTELRKEFLELASASRMRAKEIQSEITEARFKESQKSWTDTDWTTYLTSLSAQALVKKETLDSATGEMDIALAQMEYTDSLDKLWSAEQEYITTLDSNVSALKQLNSSIHDLRMDLLASELNPDQSYAYAEARYQMLLSAATSPGASNQDISDYLDYVTVYLEKANQYFSNAGDYEAIFNQVVGATGDLAAVEDSLEISINTLTESIDNLSLIIGEYTQGVIDTTPGAADGGIFNGPTSGYPMTLHGNEAVIPLNGGSVPVMLGGNNSKIESLLQTIASNIQNGSNISVVIDGGKLDGRIEKIADNNRVRADKQGMSSRSLVL